MITIHNNQLIARFSHVNRNAILRIDFVRTLRIPDDGRKYPLPPGLGSFPLRHVDDHETDLPLKWLRRGGVILPMYQSEALWIRFDSRHVEERNTSYPFAVKVATGRINAVTGESWQGGVSRNPQNYLVIPKQPWLDGYCVEKGIIRQFVAMPLGQGYTAEEQLTGEAEFGGIQIEVFPMKSDVFERRFPVRRTEVSTDRFDFFSMTLGSSKVGGMGLAPGGRMRQEIFEDPFSIHDWDLENSSRCFVHLLHSVDWRKVTGEKPPQQPLTAKEYTACGLPWFDYYDADAKALQGSGVLKKLKSIVQKRKDSRSGGPTGEESVEPKHVVELKPRNLNETVRDGTW